MFHGRALSLWFVKPRPAPIRGFGRGLLGLHGAGPVGNGDAVADLFAKESPERDAVGLSGDVQERAREGIGMRERILGKGILPGERGGCVRELGGFALTFADALDAVVGVDAAQRDGVDFGMVSGNGRNGRDFHFEEVDFGDLHCGPPLRRASRPSVSTGYRFRVRRHCLTAARQTSTTVSVFMTRACTSSRLPDISMRKAAGVPRSAA